jgi:hypothetical protein
MIGLSRVNEYINKQANKTKQNKQSAKNIKKSQNTKKMK